MNDRNRENSLTDEFENPGKAESLFGKVKNEKIFKLLINILEIIEPVAKKKRAVSKEFKFWFSEDDVCFLYIRPGSSHMTIVPAYMSMDSISSAALRYGLTLELKSDSNPKDQFDVQVKMDEDWLAKNDEKVFLWFFQNEIIEVLKENKITMRQ